MPPFRFPALLLLTAACGGGLTKPNGGGNPPAERPTLAQTYRPTGHMAAGDVVVHLFEWKWTDIATDCETPPVSKRFGSRPPKSTASRRATTGASATSR